MQDQDIKLTEAETLENANIQLEKALHTERINGSRAVLALIAQRETAFGDKVRARVQAEARAGLDDMIANAEIVELHKADGTVVPLKDSGPAAA